MTADISRHTFRPGQKYTGMVHQQGRLPLDADATEGSDLASSMLRETVASAICTKGSPDDGYRIETPQLLDDGLDFTISAGNYFLGGTHSKTQTVSYRNQPDWLTFEIDDAGPSLPALGEQRHDLIWLSVWEQVVTATQDGELLEPGLGGPDTTARRRLVGRVQVLEDVADNCPDAFQELVEQQFPGGSLDSEGCSIVSDVNLTIGFTQLDPLDDLCRPSAQNGFLGARNEAFRIQVTTPGRFVWGHNNAAPMFRVQVIDDENGQPRKLVFLTPPRDEFGWPLAGMTVELLRWGALLENREKAAEPTGLLLNVEHGYDPADDSIVVSADIPADWRTWLAAQAGSPTINPLDDPQENRYFYLRLWTGGGEGNAVDFDMSPGNTLELGDTGLTVTFSADGLAGDYWIVAARPNTPTVVSPWALLDGAPPMGPRRLIAPLAILPWTGPAPGEPVDCRNNFRPLCRIGGCCIVTVGDGRNSYGDVTSIQAAVDLLPDEGGEICIHPGEYEEHVVIGPEKVNITITGCGRNTRWHGEVGNAEPLLTILTSGVVVRRLAMTGTEAECIVVSAHLANVLIEDIRFLVSDHGAIAGFGGIGYAIRHCRILLDRLSAGLDESTEIGRAAAIFLTGDDLLIEHCSIAALARAVRLHKPVGGIHIGESERVIIRDNLILGGNGHGITFGSIQYVNDGDDDVIEEPVVESAGNLAVAEIRAHYTTNPEVAALNGSIYYGSPVYVDVAGCIRLPGTPPGDLGIPEDTPNFPESGGLVRDVQVLRNEIGLMGFSGISAHVFSGLGRDDDGLGDAVAVETIEITENKIYGCMLNEVGDLEPLLSLLIGWGGIALSICSDATIRDNTISGNGYASRDAVSGIFIAIAEDVKIERNRIEQNGIQSNDDIALNAGRRGGIVIGVAFGGVSSYGEAKSVDQSVDRPALVVSGNMVDAPGSRALKAITLGPCMVLGNRLTGAGRSVFAANPLGSLLAAGISTSILRGQLLNPRAEIDLGDYLLLEMLVEVLGGDVVNLVSLAVAEDLAGGRDRVFDSYTPQRLRGGELMVNDNQISLQRHSRQFPFNVSAVLLISADDISFCDNQAEVENDITFVLTNCLALGATMRVSSNRLQERFDAAILSAVTLGLMNQTSYNQSTHCIMALGVPQARVVTGNRNMVGLVLPELCARIDGATGGLSSGYGVRNGYSARG